MLLLTAAIFAVTVTAPDATVEKKLPPVAIEEEIANVIEEAKELVVENGELQAIIEDVEFSEEE